MMVGLPYLLLVLLIVMMLSVSESESEQSRRGAAIASVVYATTFSCVVMCKDAVVLVDYCCPRINQREVTRLLTESEKAVRGAKVVTISKTISAVVNGMHSDTRYLTRYLLDLANGYEDKYGVSAPLPYLVEEVGVYLGVELASKGKRSLATNLILFQSPTTSKPPTSNNELLSCIGVVDSSGRSHIHSQCSTSLDVSLLDVCSRIDDESKLKRRELSSRRNLLSTTNEAVGNESFAEQESGEEADELEETEEDVEWSSDSSSAAALLKQLPLSLPWRSLKTFRALKTSPWRQWTSAEATAQLQSLFRDQRLFRFEASSDSNSHNDRSSDSVSDSDSISDSISDSSQRVGDQVDADDGRLVLRVLPFHVQSHAKL